MIVIHPNSNGCLNCPEGASTLAVIVMCTRGCGRVAVICNCPESRAVGAICAACAVGRYTEGGDPETFMVETLALYHNALAAAWMDASRGERQRVMASSAFRVLRAFFKGIDREGANARAPLFTPRVIRGDGRILRRKKKHTRKFPALRMLRGGASS